MPTDVVPQPARHPAGHEVIPPDRGFEWAPTLATLADQPAAVALLATAWVGCGLAVALVIARRGYDTAPWLGLGAALGPFLIAFALDRLRHDRTVPAIVVAEGRAAEGCLTVVVVSAGDPADVASASALVESLGPRVGLLTLVRMISFDTAFEGDSPERRAAEVALSQAALFLPVAEPRMVLVAGVERDLARYAADEAAADVVVVTGAPAARAAGRCASLLPDRIVVAAPRPPDADRPAAQP